MKRRDLILASAGTAGLLLPRMGMSATPCPPPQVSVGSSSASTSCGTSAGSFSTNFSGTENPISEGGVWRSQNTTLSRVQSRPGVAHGVISYMAGYEDAYAFVGDRSFSANQEGEATIYRAAGYSPSANHEVEIILRCSDNSTSRTWYEILWNIQGGFEILYLTGPANGFFSLNTSVNNSLVPKDGDRLRGRVVGNTISGYVNDELRVQATDSRITAGSPGMAFFYRQGAVASNFGFRNFTARNL